MLQHFFNAADFICIIEFYLMQQNFFNAAEFFHVKLSTVVALFFCFLLVFNLELGSLG